MKKLTPQMVSTVILLMICLTTATKWVSARFVLDHSQRRILAPAHYKATVLPASAGVPAVDDSSEFRKTDDGQFYVRVATLGTAHHLERTTSDLLPPFILAVVGLVLTGWLQRKQSAELKGQ